MSRFLAWVAGTLMAASAFGQIDPTRTVVVVNGEEVKGLEYYRRMEYLSGVGIQLNERFVSFPPGFLTIERIITERLLLQLAKEKGVTPTDPEIQAELAIRKTDNPKLMEQWTAAGMTAKELEDQIRLDLAQFKVQTFGVTITDQEVEKFYKDNPQLFTLPKRYKLRVIVVGSDGAKDNVDAALKAGKTFQDVARDLSQDITKANGGDIGEIPESSLSDVTRGPISKSKVGGMTDWLQLGDNKVKFLVEQSLPESVQPLDDKLKRALRRRLMLDKGSVKNDVSKEMNAMRMKAKIDIKQKEFAEAYKQWLDEYLRSSGGGL